VEVKMPGIKISLSPGGYSVDFRDIGNRNGEGNGQARTYH